MAMTEGQLRQLCRKQELYSTPALNEVLYCNFQGFTHIGGLECYTALRSLFLEGNALADLVGLPEFDLACLYVQKNSIDTLRGLASVRYLRVLNIGSNRLTKLQGLDVCPHLQTLICDNNVLTDRESVASLSACTQLETLDLQANKLDDSKVLEVLQALPALCSLYLKGNPLAATVGHCRKTLIGSIPTLTYVDDRPVSELERLCSEAWYASGIDAERQARKQFQDEAAVKARQNTEIFQAMREESFLKGRVPEGLPHHNSDVYDDAISVGSLTELTIEEIDSQSD